MTIQVSAKSSWLVGGGRTRLANTKKSTRTKKWCRQTTTIWCCALTLAGLEAFETSSLMSKRRHTLGSFRIGKSSDGFPTTSFMRKCFSRSMRPSPFPKHRVCLFMSGQYLWMIEASDCVDRCQIISLPRVFVLAYTCYFNQCLDENPFATVDTFPGLY